jgi:anti-sigma factor RsiW
MSARDVTEADLHAWLDGELPQERRAEVDAYVAAHPEDAARLDAYRRNEQSLVARFDPVLVEEIPPRLRRSRRAPPRLALRVAAAVGWLVLGGIAGWNLHGLKGPELRSEAPSWARNATVAHIVYSPEVRHPVEVAADQEAHLVAWLSKRLGTRLKIPRLDAVGFGLVGGRLLPGEQGPAAQFMYQDAKGLRLTLYVRANRDQKRETAFRFAQEGNVRQFYWIDRGLGYALSGEIGKDDLLRIATTVYQQLNP